MPSPQPIRRPRQIRALASPLRQEILDVLESLGPSTIAALAQRLARRPDSLYFHVRKLEGLGLLTRSGVTGSGRGEAALYDVPGRPMQLIYGDTPAARSTRLLPPLDAVLRLARR